ncbi:MAG: transcription-repair coupling factor [Nitriliruptorales bacterium]|nr:transcription-repair coupling factor [Nitriliruptorales bacterium]
MLSPARERFDELLDDPVIGAPAATRGLLLALLAERRSPLLVVVPRTSDAEDVADGIAAFLGADRVAVFPAWETLPHERLSPQPATVGQRLAVLDRLVDPGAHPHELAAVVAPVRAALQPMDPALGQRRPIRLSIPYEGSFEQLVDDLAGLGYVRSPQVESRGEFAVRGGIIDVFATAAEHATRIEFWGDDIESLRTFSVADQRTIGPVEHVQIDPARELVLNQAARERAAELARAHPTLREQLGMLADGIAFEGAESLTTLLHPRPALLPDFLGDAGAIAILDPELAAQRADALRVEAETLLEVAWETAAGHRPEDAGFAEFEQLTDLGRPTTIFSPFAMDVEASPWESFRGDVTTLAERLRGQLADGRRVIVSTSNEGSSRRLRDVLGENAVAASLVDEVGPDSPARVEIVTSRFRQGFRSDALGLALLGDLDVFGPRRRRATRRMGARRAAADTVSTLQPGDAVVHRTHGVGRFGGMVTRELRTPTGDVITRDYVLVEYAGDDSLYVPADQVDALARYQGGDPPNPMRLGGRAWERAKSRARGAVRDIAAELIRLYAARMHSPGHAFSPDGAMQQELEDSFAHRETDDQLTVIDEIKRDMEAPVPMDRLLCGDVGFGKTEVAVRAAGKAVFDGMQVAVLVPTTILAQQHFETFRERFAGFPVDVRMLSRFVSDAERREILDGVAAGTVDICIGTHALLATSVAWKRLGLVVVDEEQRFGVSQKERLKHLRTNVDVLSMTATPIPRTMEMAIGGIRDLSTIETPPEDRQPVVTVVSEYDDDQVALAIRRELLRDGQVFHVHNQVSTIHSVAEHLRQLVPGARIAVAHGQMDEHALEQVMIRFWEREIDVLVCTTIIESGLDIPNANTLIIERADLLGLSQLHQLRGRVGRSSVRGYAYFLHPPGASLTEQAYERLATIADHSSLGSGLGIAIRDLEIRGAGNVVGAEQSGHVAAVGFDMFATLLREEVADLTGEPMVEEAELRVEIPVEANLPHGWVTDDRQRLDLYKRIAAVRDAAGVRSMRDELQDRFGPLPTAAERLLAITALKAAMRRWGIEELSITGAGRLRVQPVALADSQQVRLQRDHSGGSWTAPEGPLVLPVPTPWPDDLVGWTARTLGGLLA